MKLAYWMYAGPAHIGVLRVTSSFKNVHAIMHAPLGDDYFNVMRSMLERERDFTPVTASIVDRHVLARGSQEKVVENIVRKNKEEAPDLILLTPTCTSSILQEDLSNFVERSTLSLTTISNSTSISANKNSQETIINTGIAVKGPETFNSLEHLEAIANYTSTQKDVAGLLSYNKDNQNGTFIKSQVSENIFSQQDQKLAFASIPHTQSYNQLAQIPAGDTAGKGQQEGCEDVILADVNHYRVNELQAADRTLEQIVRYYIEKAKKHNNLDLTKTEQPSVNIIGIFTLGFHNQHDCRELKRLFNDLGIIINEIIPEGGNVNNLKNLPKAWFNFIPYREVGLMTAVYLKSEFNMPYVSTTPMGLVSTALCIREIEKIILEQLSSMDGPVGACFARPLNIDSLQKENLVTRPLPVLTASASLDLKGLVNQASGGKTKKNVLEDLSLPQVPSVSKLRTLLVHKDVQVDVHNLFNEYIDQQTRFVSQAAWFSRSIDCQNLTGKKAVVFGDATHSAAMTKILAREMGIRVSCAGTYCKHDADWFREQVTGFCDQILITDDHTLVGDTIAQLEPAAIFGTQMERHVGKRLDIPCGVISSPVHIQNFPLGYRPFLGYEGTNQIADLVYNSFNLGMEDHLLQIFGGHDSVVIENNNTQLNQDIMLGGVSTKKSEHNGGLGLETQNLWSSESLAELNKVPGFVRGKVKRNTEKYALQNNISNITVEVMYAAKEALSN